MSPCAGLFGSFYCSRLKCILSDYYLLIGLHFPIPPQVQHKRCLLLAYVGLMLERVAQQKQNVKKVSIHLSIYACHPYSRGHANLLCIVPIFTDDDFRHSDFL